MDGNAFSIQQHSSAGFLFDRETPFSPFYSAEDAPASPSPTQPPSPGGSSSSISSIRSQHRYCLTNGKGKGNDQPWLTLLVSSRSPRPKFLPFFIGKDTISGIVELDLAKPETVREVKVTIKGETIHFTQEPHTFLEISHILIRQPSRKLSGKYSYPFSFVLPDNVRVDELNWVMVYPLPPKFHEKGSLYIDYKIVVTVRHGLFSVDNSLMTNIVYMPETIAEPPSALREQAYLKELPVALPVLDPGGWKMLPPVEAVDTLVPNATATARLSIANPLSFALGTPIPLFLELSNDGATYVDPNSIDVRLVRTLTTRGVSGGVHKLDVARAVFWPASDSSPRRIKLCGEVIAGRSFTPSFVFSKCSVQYSIVLYPMHLPEQTKPDPLLEEEVLLALRNAQGVVPRSQAPPGVTPAQIELQPSRLFPVDFGLVRVR
ncbi:hypothetical protein DFH94DRAFT_162877 [Russula ochroleuca]|uniref:Arrestin-like N-terminal domain-containing protein n=1 Tax=Russula ochroleuca TaxID=152965 RepID=A0A9P5N3Y1_9AGAM|nr:hypothetical protein DFH94DRAFT_162877 [Russula ochroleuca]